MHWANNPLAREDLKEWGQRNGHSIWEYLSYKDETVRWSNELKRIGVETNMCDVNMQLNRHTGEVAFQLYDKALHLGEMSERMLKYPRGDSQQKWAHKIGIIQSQMERIYNKSDSENKFVRDALRMMLRVRWNGIEKRSIQHRIHKWSPRQTIHMPWRATERTTWRIKHALDVNEQEMSRKDPRKARRVQAGVTNWAMEKHIQFLVENSLRRWEDG